MRLIPLEEALTKLRISYNGFWKGRAKGQFRKVQVVQHAPKGRYKVIAESVEEQIKADTLSMEGV